MRFMCCVGVVVLFSGNKLTSLPDSFAHLTQLTTLILKCVPILTIEYLSLLCILTCISDGLFVMRSDNPIQSLPPTLSWLIALCVVVGCYCSLSLRVWSLL